MKSALLTIVLLLSMGLAHAEVACQGAGINVLTSPNENIALCDDPQDSTCEADFASICPADFHLCSSTDFNANNDDWHVNAPQILAGQIQCREAGGAGHFTIFQNHLLSEDLDNNMIAGSSLHECPSDYGCNEKWMYAACCADVSNDVPEFTTVGIGLALAGAGLAIFLFNRR